MHVVDVFPIARGVPFTTLSYFSSHEYARGVLVSVPFRSNTVPAVIKSSRSAKQAKSRIKSADYTLQKLPKQDGRHFFTPAFLAAAEDIAAYFATTVGAVLYELTPQPILQDLPEAKPGKHKQKNRNTNLHILQEKRAGRFKQYARMHAEARENDESVFFLAPSGIRATTLAAYLSDQTDANPIRLDGSLSKSEIRTRWEEAVDSSSSVVMTPHFLSLPVESVQTIAIEHEGSDAYKQQQRPYLDLRTCGRMLAEAYGADLMYADTVLRPETFQTATTADTAETEITEEYESDSRQLLVDMKTHADDTDEGFATFSDPLADILETESGRIFLLVGRVGLHPFSVCGDCGETLLCENCETPMTLKQDKEERSFVCNRCGNTRTSETVCDNCGSWKLWPLGIGTDAVAELVQEKYSHRDIFQVDSDTTTTRKQIQEEIDAFQDTDNGVLVGTQQAIDYLNDFETTGIVSIDSQLSLPDFRTGERVFRMLTQLRLKTKENFIIQTRNSQTETLSSALKGDLAEFFKKLLAEREEFDYPPYSLLIRVSITDFKDSAQERIDAVDEKVSNYRTAHYPAFGSKGGGKQTRHVLIHIPPEKWPDAKLISQLRDLDPAYAVDVDPLSIL